MALEGAGTVAEPVEARGARTAARAWVHRTFDSLSDRNLRILWIGTLLNFVGVTMNQTAQGVVAFDLTGNSRAVGTVMLGMGLSLLFISPFAGALADRVAKRTMLVTCQVIAGATYFFIAIAIIGDFINIPILAVSAFITGTMFAMIRSVRNAYIGELARPEQRGNAVAVQQLAMTTMMVSGPFLAGILLGWDVFGASGTYIVMAGAFAFAIVTMLQLPSAKPAERTAGSSNLLQDTITGMKYGWSNPEIQWVLGGFLLLTIVGMPYITLLPGYAKDELGVSTSNLGLLLGISAGGGFLVSLVAASMADSPRAPLLLAACNVVFGLSLLGLWLAPSFAVAALICLFLGAGASGFQVLNLAVALRAAEVAYMGRVAALTMMASSMSGIVAFPVGALADRYGERDMLLAMGLSVLVVAGILMVWRQRAPRAPASEA
jgi:MFS family permease